VDEGSEFITAQGFMFDLQKNVAIEINVPRRIVDSQGNRFKVDMIGVTASAAASIALRNAILKVVPKALWHPIYEKAKATALGTEATLNTKRTDALAWFQKKGASAATIFEHLGVQGIEDITLDHIAILLGYKTALKEGDVTVESLFNNADPTGDGKQAPRTMADVAAKGTPAPPAAAPSDGAPVPPTADALKTKLKAAKTEDAVDTWGQWITEKAYPDAAVRLGLIELYEARKAEFTK
jgi:hypothetical protein